MRAQLKVTAVGKQVNWISSNTYKYQKNLKSDPWMLTLEEITVCDSRNLFDQVR